MTNNKNKKKKDKTVPKAPGPGDVEPDDKTGSETSPDKKEESESKSNSPSDSRTSGQEGGSKVEHQKDEQLPSKLDPFKGQTNSDSIPLHDKALDAYNKDESTTVPTTTDADDLEKPLEELDVSTFPKIKPKYLDIKINRKLKLFLFRGSDAVIEFSDNILWLPSYRAKLDLIDTTEVFQDLQFRYNLIIPGVYSMKSANSLKCKFDDLLPFEEELAQQSRLFRQLYDLASAGVRSDTGVDVLTPQLARSIDRSRALFDHMYWSQADFSRHEALFWYSKSRYHLPFERTVDNQILITAYPKLGPLIGRDFTAISSMLTPNVEFIAVLRNFLAERVIDPLAQMGNVGPLTVKSLAALVNINQSSAIPGFKSLCEVLSIPGAYPDLSFTSHTQDAGYHTLLEFLACLALLPRSKFKPTSMLPILKTIGIFARHVDNWAALEQSFRLADTGRAMRLAGFVCRGFKPRQFAGVPLANFSTLLAGSPCTDVIDTIDGRRTFYSFAGNSRSGEPGLLYAHNLVTSEPLLTTLTSISDIMSSFSREISGKHMVLQNLEAMQSVLFTVSVATSKACRLTGLGASDDAVHPIAVSASSLASLLMYGIRLPERQSVSIKDQLDFVRLLNVLEVGCATMCEYDVNVPDNRITDRSRSVAMWYVQNLFELNKADASLVDGILRQYNVDRQVRGVGVLNLRPEFFQDDEYEAHIRFIMPEVHLGTMNAITYYGSVFPDIRVARPRRLSEEEVYSLSSLENFSLPNLIMDLLRQVPNGAWCPDGVVRVSISSGAENSVTATVAANTEKLQVTYTIAIKVKKPNLNQLFPRLYSCNLGVAYRDMPKLIWEDGSLSITLSGERVSFAVYNGDWARRRREYVLDIVDI